MSKTWQRQIFLVVMSVTNVSFYQGPFCIIIGIIGSNTCHSKQSMWWYISKQSIKVLSVCKFRHMTECHYSQDMLLSFLSLKFLQWNIIKWLSSWKDLSADVCTSNIWCTYLFLPCLLAEGNHIHIHIHIVYIPSYKIFT